MTPGEFIEVFDTIAEAPGGIERLRELVLQLAVRGKLVPQDEGEEPASELLRRAKAAKIREMIERKIRRDSAPELSESAGEASSPNHWAWTHLHDFALVLGGKRLPAGASFSTEKTDNIYIRVTDMKNGSISTKDLRYISDDVQSRIAKYTIDREDLYITIAGTIGDVGDVPEHFHGQNLTENAAKIVFREVDKRFLLLVLRSGDVKEQFQEKMKQMAQPKLALKRISCARVPIPPLAEQQRIVAKVDELMGLLDRLEVVRRSRDAVRTEGRDSALAALRNAATPQEVGTAWTLIAERMDDLFTAPADLTPLREAVLQLAVRGRLVPQDADEEPASQLLEAVVEKKANLVKEKKLRRRKPDSPLMSDEIPFEIPQSWVWARLHDLGHDLGQKVPDETFSYIDVSVVDNKRGLIPSEVPVLDPSAAPSRARKLVRPGSVIYSTVRPYLLNIAVIEREYSPMPIASTAFAVLHPYSGVHSRLLFFWLRSPFFTDFVTAQMKGVAYPAISDTDLLRAPMPLPPAAEQHRIVAKVDELMELIDRLEQHFGAKEGIQGDFAAAAVYNF